MSRESNKKNLVQSNSNERIDDNETDDLNNDTDQLNIDTDQLNIDNHLSESCSEKESYSSSEEEPMSQDDFEYPFQSEK